MEFTLLVIGIAIAAALGVRKAVRELRGPSEPARVIEIGWLYFIGNGRGPIKVGITRSSPEERCADLQTGNPTRLQVLYAVAVQDLEAAEGEAHNLLAEHHVGGEWYKREPTLALMHVLQMEHAREEGGLQALLETTKGEP